MFTLLPGTYATFEDRPTLTQGGETVVERTIFAVTVDGRGVRRKRAEARQWLLRGTNSKYGARPFNSPDAAQIQAEKMRNLDAAYIEAYSRYFATEQDKVLGHQGKTVGTADLAEIPFEPEAPTVTRSPS